MAHNKRRKSNRPVLTVKRSDGKTRAAPETLPTATPVQRQPSPAVRSAQVNAEGLPKPPKIEGLASGLGSEGMAQGYDKKGMWTPQDDSVTTALNKITDKDSDLMKSARTKGVAFANRRGLLNSTMAAQAGEAAVLDVAVPLAQQESSNIATKNLSAQAYAQEDALAQDKFANDASLADKNFGFQKQLNAQNFGFQSKLNDQNFNNQKGLAFQRFNQEKYLANQELQSSERKFMAEMDVRLQQFNMDLNARERGTILNATLEADRTYQNTLSNISSNPELPTSERSRLEQLALQQKEASLLLLEDLYGIELDWTSALGTYKPVTPVDLSGIGRG